jgi:hypothetical protein
MTFTPGFDPSEAKTLIAISAALEMDNPAPVIPANWQLDFDSPELGPFANKYQLWKNTAISGQYALVIRGTVDQRGSIAEDLLSVMIPASGSLHLGPIQFSYTLAKEPNAGVHLGFTLGLSFLLFDGVSGILAQLYLIKGQVRDLFVAGHSQGAAVATLCRSFFEYAPAAQPLGLGLKTYVFAQPKPGNDHYAYDFESFAGNGTMAFQVSNSLDWVPQVPLTLEWLDDVNQPNPLSEFLANDSVLADLGNVRSRLRAEATARQLARIAPHLGTLGAVLAQQALQPVAAAAIGVEASLHILPSLYFFNAGARIILTGGPCPTPDCDGGWYQHHATTYYNLLEAQYPG